MPNNPYMSDPNPTPVPRDHHDREHSWVDRRPDLPECNTCGRPMRQEPATVAGAGRGLDGSYCGHKCLARAAAGLAADDNEAMAQLQRRLELKTTDADDLRRERDEADSQLTSAEALYVQLLQLAPDIKDGRLPGVAGGPVRKLAGQLRDELRPKVRGR